MYSYNIDKENTKEKVQNPAGGWKSHGEKAQQGHVHKTRGIDSR